MKELDLTVILPLRNRPIEIVKKCVDSLLNQNPMPKVIVVDMGSDEDKLEWYRKNIPFTFIEVINKQEKWNFARAYNIGVNHTQTKYVASSNIDCIFSIDFMKQVDRQLSYMDTGHEKYFMTCRVTDLDEEGRSDLSGKRHNGKDAIGGFWLLPTEWVKKVHGMDEHFLGWGYEDTDYLERIKKDGFLRFDVSHLTLLFHQWHEPANIRLPIFNYEANKEWYIAHKGEIVKNLEGWGEL